MSHQLIIKGSLRRARFTLDLDLAVDLSKPLGIIGATGAGKTTLLR
jgi:ABC-type methionine transport system ATPase subunit